MRAKDVYEKYSRDIKILTEHMRKEGIPGHMESETRNVFVTSVQPFEPDLDFSSSQVLGAEFVAQDTMCQVTPIRKNDLRLTCIEIEDEDQARKIADCVKPIALDIMKELFNLSVEQESVVIDLIPKVINGLMTNEQAAEDMKRRLSKSYRDEEEILKYYINYRDSHCGKIHKTLTKIETIGDKVVETEIRSTRQLNL
jgi:hypothetical protein